MLGPYSLVLNLKVQVSGEPVIEKGLLNIAGGCQLWRQESSCNASDLNRYELFTLKSAQSSSCLWQELEDKKYLPLL